MTQSSGPHMLWCPKLLIANWWGPGDPIKNASPPTFMDPSWSRMCCKCCSGWAQGSALLGLSAGFGWLGGKKEKQLCASALNQRPSLVDARWQLQSHWAHSKAKTGDERRCWPVYFFFSFRVRPNRLDKRELARCQSGFQAGVGMFEVSARSPFYLGQWKTALP